jgi:hypothetical protein
MIGTTHARSSAQQQVLLEALRDYFFKTQQQESDSTVSFELPSDEDILLTANTLTPMQAFNCLVAYFESDVPSQKNV